LGFLATFLAKDYLAARFALVDFDVAEKAQGAPGADIEARTQTGETIRCEIKTTRPYQPGFGAQQKKTIKADLRKLMGCDATHRFMMVTDMGAFHTLCKPYYAPLAQRIDVVNLLTGENYRHADRSKE
jgi:hypothetical protein